ncbi:MAG: hypothetical protein OEW37_00085 [Rhodospirillaceae bacterium]|nr:hypothetical protein [Rhodospirillaceae bacterium]
MAIADDFGVTPKTARSWCDGDISLRSLKRIADATGVRRAWLILGEGAAFNEGDDGFNDTPDEETLREIVTLLFEEAAGLKIEITPDLVATMAAELYGRHTKNPQPTRNIINYILSKPA